MAYKFQFGTARLSGALQQEGHIQVASASQDVIGVATELGASDYFAQMKYSAADSGGIMELADSNGATVFFAGSILSGSAMNTLAHDGLSFTQASGQLAVNVDDSSIEINADSLRLKDDGVTLAKMAGIARGSIISGDASGDPQALTVGSAHQFLQSDGTDLAYVSMSGDATLAAGAITISDNAVTLAKMAGITRGSIIIGDASGDPSALATGTAHQFLQSDGTDTAYVTMSGDATLAAGVLSIGATKVTDAMLNDDVATGLAGDGLAATSGVLAVNVSGAVKLASDTVGISGSIAGAGLAYVGGVDSISALSVDLNEFAAADVNVAADSLVFIDADGNVSRQDSFADYATAAAGDGLAASSGQFDLDLNELTAAVVNVAADSIAIVDADDNSSKKESIADLVTAMAGAGLAATSGVLSVQSNNVALKADTQTLVEGFQLLC